MAVESAADRLAFLADFGVTVSWTVGVTASELLALFHSGSVRIEAEHGAGVLNNRATLQLRAADVPVGGGLGDAVAIEGTGYTVKSIEPDGTGMATVLLEEDID